MQADVACSVVEGTQESYGSDLAKAMEMHRGGAAKSRGRATSQENITCFQGCLLLSRPPGCEEYQKLDLYAVQSRGQSMMYLWLNLRKQQPTTSIPAD